MPFQYLDATGNRRRRDTQFFRGLGETLPSTGSFEEAQTLQRREIRHCPFRLVVLRCDARNSGLTCCKCMSQSSEQTSSRRVEEHLQRRLSQHLPDSEVVLLRVETPSFKLPRNMPSPERNMALWATDGNCDSFNCEHSWEDRTRVSVKSMRACDCMVETGGCDASVSHRIGSHCSEALPGHDERLMKTIRIETLTPPCGRAKRTSCTPSGCRSGTTFRGLHSQQKANRVRIGVAASCRIQLIGGRDHGVKMCRKCTKVKRYIKNM